MTPFEIAFQIALVLGGLVAADYYLVRRSSRRAFRVIKAEVMKMPAMKSLNRLMNDPNFEEFALETLDSFKILNKLMKKIEKEGILSVLKK